MCVTMWQHRKWFALSIMFTFVVFLTALRTVKSNVLHKVDVLRRSTTGFSTGHRYAFLTQAHSNGPATESVVANIRRWHRAERIFVFTDACGLESTAINFTNMCTKYACQWLHDGKSGGHGQKDQIPESGYIYMRRIFRVLHMCDCEYLVVIEDDTCVHMALTKQFDPDAHGDLGGLPWDPFSPEFVKMAAEHSGVDESRVAAAVTGCSTGCYYRTSFFLEKEEKFTRGLVLKAASFAPVHFADVIGPAFVVMMGGNVTPWHAVSERSLGADVAGILTDVPVAKLRPFEHSKNCLFDDSARTASDKVFPTCTIDSRR